MFGQRQLEAYLKGECESHITILIKKSHNTFRTSRLLDFCALVDLARTQKNRTKWEWQT